VNAPSRRPWTLASPSAEPLAALQRLSGVTPLQARLLANRGHLADEACKAHLQQGLELHDPMQLPDMQAAVERLHRAVEEGETILVHGDYDVDGVTGTTILVRLLRLLGASVEWHIPHRMRDGYSFGDHSIARAEAVGARVVVSVDNGTSAVEVIRQLKERGIDTVVTDHHEPPLGDLPPAVAIVNPKLPGSKYPFRELCGGAVAFKLAWGLCQRVTGAARVRPDLRDFLIDSMSLVAVATVCDVVPLLDENRSLARSGLRSLAATRHAGTRALLRVCRLDKQQLTASDVGFGIGPRLNAAGRLDSAARSVELLLCEDEGRARTLAEELEALNTQRKAMTETLLESARAQARQFGDAAEWPVLVLGEQGWHQGLVGIAAGRLVEEFGRPALVIGFDGEEGRGSARTVEGVDVLALMHAGKEHMQRYGGHAQAAGCEARVEDLPALREAICSAAREAGVADRSGPAPLAVDAELPWSEVSESLQRQLDHLAPWGERNPEPLFLASGIRLAEPARAVGDGKHLLLKLRDGDAVLKGMAFFQGGRIAELQQGADLHVVFTPTWNEFRGQRNLEVRILDFAVGARPQLA
jgi:single-stranded-DNA-specific exonuclease